MSYFQFLFLFSCIFAEIADAQIKVVGPHDLASQFENPISYSLAHYGKVRYGSQLFGQMILVEPIEACTPLEPFFADYEDPENHIPNAIALIRRGGCRVATKTRNAQIAGARAVIIVNNIDQELGDRFGHELETEDIKIPSVMVNLQDGEKLVWYIQNQQLKEETADIPVMASIKFPTEEKFDFVVLDFWFSSFDPSKSSYFFLKRFHHFWEENKEFLSFTPHYISWSCEQCKEGQFSLMDEGECISGGRYCAYPEDGGTITGADVIVENLRQACIFQTSPTLWWKYVLSFGDTCLEEKKFKSCGEGMLKTLNMDQAKYLNINKCMEETFVKPENETTREMNIKLDDNTILSQERAEQNEFGIAHYPALLINHQAYNGRLHPEMIFFEVCKNYKIRPDECAAAFGDGKFKRQSKKVFLLVISLTVLTLLAFLCYKRVMKRDSTEISKHVGGSVSRYFALSESSEGDLTKINEKHGIEIQS